jgi:hypothetical protein
MAEERLTDTDLNKDRKYRIRKNKDGEDELVVDESAIEDEEEVEFTVPEFAYDVENVENLTPEQYEEFLKKRAKEEELKEQAFHQHFEDAKLALEQKEYEAVLHHAEAILAEDENNAKALAFKLRALSRDFTDVIELAACADVADQLKGVEAPDLKAELSAAMEPFYKAELTKREAQAKQLSDENEAKKADRRTRFVQKKKVALQRFLCALVPFVVFLALTIGFACVVTARENGLFVILTSAFGGLCVLALVFTLITSHYLIDAGRKVRLNERDSSTKLGRELISVQTEIDQINRILSSVE